MYVLRRLRDLNFTNKPNAEILSVTVGAVLNCSSVFEARQLFLFYLRGLYGMDVLNIEKRDLQVIDDRIKMYEREF